MARTHPPSTGARTADLNATGAGLLGQVAVIYTRDERLARMTTAMGEQMRTRGWEILMIPWTEWHGSWEEWTALKCWARTGPGRRTVVICLGAETVRAAIARSTRGREAVGDRLQTELRSTCTQIRAALGALPGGTMHIRPIRAQDLHEPLEVETECAQDLLRIEPQASHWRWSCTGRDTAWRVRIDTGLEHILRSDTTGASDFAAELAAWTGRPIPESWERRWVRQGVALAAWVLQGL